MQVAQTIFSLASMYLPTLPISQDSIPQSQHSFFRARVATFHLILASILTVVGIVCLVLYKERPRLAPSPTSVFERATIRDSLSHLKEDHNILLATLSFGLSAAAVNGFIMVFESAFREYGASTL